jgi:hypothetical protein
VPEVDSAAAHKPQTSEMMPKTSSGQAVPLARRISTSMLRSLIPQHILDYCDKDLDGIVRSIYVY